MHHNLTPRHYELGGIISWQNKTGIPTVWDNTVLVNPLDYYCSPKILGIWGSKAIRLYPPMRQWQDNYILYLDNCPMYQSPDLPKVLKFASRNYPGHLIGLRWISPIIKAARSLLRWGGLFGLIALAWRILDALNA